MFGWNGHTKASIQAAAVASRSCQRIQNAIPIHVNDNIPYRRGENTNLSGSDHPFVSGPDTRSWHFPRLAGSRLRAGVEAGQEVDNVVPASFRPISPRISPGQPTDLCCEAPRQSLRFPPVHVIPVGWLQLIALCAFPPPEDIASFRLLGTKSKVRKSVLCGCCRPAARATAAVGSILGSKQNLKGHRFTNPVLIDNLRLGVLVL